MIDTLVYFLVWVAVVLFIVGLFSASKRNDRRVEDDRRRREGLPPIDWDREP